MLNRHVHLLNRYPADGDVTCIGFALSVTMLVSPTCRLCHRFWHDEKRFRGSGEVWLAQHMLFAAGGTRMGGNFKEAHAQGYMGWQQPHK